MEDSVYRQINRVLGKQLARQARHLKEARESLALKQEALDFVTRVYHLERAAVQDKLNDLADARRGLVRLRAEKAELQQRHEGVVKDGYRLRERLTELEVQHATVRSEHAKAARELDAMERDRDELLERVNQAPSQLDVDVAQEERDSALVDLRRAVAEAAQLQSRLDASMRCREAQDIRLAELESRLEPEPTGHVHITMDPREDQGDARVDAQHLVDNYLASDHGRGHRSLPRKPLVRQITELMLQRERRLRERAEKAEHEAFKAQEGWKGANQEVEDFKRLAAERLSEMMDLEQRATEADARQAGMEKKIREQLEARDAQRKVIQDYQARIRRVKQTLGRIVALTTQDRALGYHGPMGAAHNAARTLLRDLDRIYADIPATGGACFTYEGTDWVPIPPPCLRTDGCPDLERAQRERNHYARLLRNLADAAGYALSCGKKMGDCARYRLSGCLHDARLGLPSGDIGPAFPDHAELTQELLHVKELLGKLVDCFDREREHAHVDALGTYPVLTAARKALGRE